MALPEKCNLADFVINNSGDIASTEGQIKDVYGTLRASKRHWIIRGGLLVGLAFGLWLLCG